MHARTHLLELHAGEGDGLLDRPLLGEQLPKHPAGLGASAQLRQGPLGETHRAHAVVDTARPQPRLRHGEAAALDVEEAGARHAHVVEGQLRVAVGSVVVAEDGQHALPATGEGSAGYSRVT